MAREIFVSYRRGDSPGFAGRLYDRLEGAFGDGSVFMDVDGIDPGMDFVDVLNAQLDACQAVVAIIGPEWLRAKDAQGRRRLDDPNDFVRLEISTALARGVRIIPVLVEGAQPPATDDLPEALHPLARRQAVSISHERFAQDIQPLISALERAVKPAAAPSGPAERSVAARPATVRAALANFVGAPNLFLAPQIPANKIANARKKAHIPADAEIHGLIDFTVFGNANDSLSFTDAGVYYHHSLNSAGAELQFLPIGLIQSSPIAQVGAQKISVGPAILHIDGGAKPAQVAQMFEAIKGQA